MTYAALSVSLALLMACDVILGFPDVVYKSDYQWVSPGDINLGAILSIHSPDSLFSCKDYIQDVRNIQTVEALNFAVKEINNRNDLLQNLTLGFYILDDCLSTQLALARAIQFMPRGIREGKPTQSGHVTGETLESNDMRDSHFYDVIGVIGAYTSKLSMVVANALTIFHLPQISYSATSNALSDKTRFPYFFRMVPPDHYQVKTIASILRRFNWTHVSLVFSGGTYGRDGVKELERAFKQQDSNICIEQKIEISFGSNKQEYSSLLERLASSAAPYTKTSVVVVFLDIQDAKMLAESIKDADLVGMLIWVGSDSLNIILEESPKRCTIFPGAISVRPYSSLNDKFRQHLNDLFDGKETLNNTRNPWIAAFLTRDQALQNNDNSESRLIPQSKRLRPRFIDSFIIDSVYAFAHSLDEVIERRCPDYLFNLTDISDCVSRSDVYNELKTLTFNGSSGSVAFNKDGDVMTKYEVFQCHGNSSKPEVVSVGFWYMENESLSLFGDRLIWDTDSVPVSACPKPCTDSIGSIYYFTKQTCCHVCVQCKVNEIVTANATRCEVCPELFWPDDTRSKCITIPPFYFSPLNPVSISLITIAVIGLVTCVVIAVVLSRFRHEHVIRCFSLDLSGVILFGTGMAFCLTGVFLSKPSQLKCFINHVGFSFTFTVLYAPLLVKTNRIYRIFNAGKRTTKRPEFISNSSQVILSLALIFVQVNEC